MYFQSTSVISCRRSFPPDFLHDVLEGVVPQDLFGIIKILVKKVWFTIQEYNQSLNKYRSGSNDKPQEVPKKTTKMKLVGKAVSHWVHIGYFGLIISGFVQDSSDPVLALGMQLLELTERLTAEQFRLYEIDVIEEKVIEYLEARKLVYDEFPNLMGTA